jgi:hypothetical protein
MTRTIRAALALLTVAGLAAIAAPAASASDCGNWSSYNRTGSTYAKVSHVVPRQGMNCASARYVSTKWLQRAYQRSSLNRLPTRFYDGYVTWYCGRTSYYGWRCNEYTSGTAFTFRAEAWS